MLLLWRPDGDGQHRLALPEGSATWQLAERGLDISRWVARTDLAATGGGGLPVLTMCVCVWTGSWDPANTAAAPGGWWSRGTACTRWTNGRRTSSGWRPGRCGSGWNEQAVIPGADVTVLDADTSKLVRAGGGNVMLRY